MTPTHIFTFKEERKYKNPTETVILKECTTVKSAEDEIHKENSFVNKKKFHSKITKNSIEN